jgi:hypothetical protein
LSSEPPQPLLQDRTLGLGGKRIDEERIDAEAVTHERPECEIERQK